MVRQEQEGTKGGDGEPLTIFFYGTDTLPEVQ